jgi:GFO/IDH/MocA oxidoreductase family protein
MYIRNTNWEVVPERNAEFPIGYAAGKGYGSPLSRTTGSASNASMKPAMEPRKAAGTTSSDTTAHTRNFLDCIKTRGKCNADILTGHISTSATLIGNIAHKTRSVLEWDAKAERFTNQPAANRWLHYSYRAPYKLG